jgi:hypothetical protein
MESMIGPQTGRLDRHVRRSYLRIGESASRHRITYSLEEALRLVNLPGEDEGRIYCFQRVSLSGISAEANRRIWIEAMQQLLTAMAAQAVHGTHPSAGASNVVFFHNRAEALETLLRQALRQLGKAAPARPEWYSASLLGVAEGTSYQQQIPAIIERLRSPSITPDGAAILFAALGDIDPGPLLSAIPSETIRVWVQELDGPQNAAGDVPALQLPQRLETALRRAAADFGWKDPGTVWLAAQAVLCVAPNTWSSGTAVKRARSTLRTLEAEQRWEPKERAVLGNRSDRSGTLVFNDESRLGTERQPLLEAGPVSWTQELAHPKALPAESVSGTNEPPHSEARLIDTQIGRPPVLGEITSCAGLYFLLNALRQLRIVDVLQACPALAEADFTTHILKRLSVRAGVADDDPILLCLSSVETEFLLSPDVLADLQQKTACFPAGFAWMSLRDLDSDSLLRIWMLAVRRWCWRTGRLSLRDIVHRTGRVWLTRTDLDVTLPLQEADIRIRRIGLDIDPGWLPWFGVRGRVVRFHYRDREPGAPTC